MPAAPPAPRTDAELEDRLSEPTPGLPGTLTGVAGDLLILGAGGKMGPSLARMARRAFQALGRADRVIAVSRFGDPAVRAALDAAGVVTLAADLLADGALEALPDAPNVVFMAGQKFGTSGDPASTWAMNALLPALAARRYPAARTVVFSTGNVYPLWPAARPGPTEADPVGPVGEYAMSCLARERLYQHASLARGTPVTIVRLNYAVDRRYGVLVDIARRVHAGEPVPLAMGYANVLWQGDANAMALQCLALATSPAIVVNLTGPEKLSVRAVAEAFGRRFGKAVRFEGTEAPDALLSDASALLARLGPPTVPLATLLEWVAAWLEQGGRLLAKPTRFEARDGRF